MTAQFLTNELTNLVQEAKRKNSDLRHVCTSFQKQQAELTVWIGGCQAAEKSLSDLKSLGPLTEVAAELSSKPGFLSPFLIACGTRNAKYSTIGVVCLQRLIVSRALAKSRLKEVLEAFREAANLGVDIQLKILQALPPLLQNYAEDLNGNLLGEALLICSILQGSKMGVVNNTAAATLSQIVISIFDKVVTEDERGLDIPATGEAPTSNGPIPLRPAALDAHRVFNDITLLTEGQRPTFLRFPHLPQPFGLELIESVLTNHPDIFLTHPEQAHTLRTRVAPLIMRALSERLNFPTTVRITRVLYILLRRHLSILTDECEIALSLLTHMLDPDASAPWKRALCMEVFRGICAEPALVRRIFTAYDAAPNRRHIVADLMGALTRLATEKPAIIGLGTTSSAPVGNDQNGAEQQAALEAGGVTGIIGVVAMGDMPVPGLSTQWSLVRVPCIDQLDKSEPPAMPESYVYCLTLACVNSFCEGLAKFILPLTTTGDGKKVVGKSGRARGGSAVVRVGTGLSVAGQGGSDSETPVRGDSPARTPSPAPGGKGAVKRKPMVRMHRVPVNPLTLENHPLQAEIAISAAIMESCWPAILAACSTFLYATLDNEFYHGLVRSFQKFTHVAGLLRLTTPRDAFLTTLGKAAVPSNVLTANIAATPGTGGEGGGGGVSGGPGGFMNNAKGLLTADGLSTSGERSLGMSVEAPPGLNSRNLLCLRALLNLGIALGPTLERSWSIILETLQQADYVLFASSRKSGRQISLNAPRADSQKPPDASSLSNIGPELTAVETAAMKMFESTLSFPDTAFVSILYAMCALSTPTLDPDSRTSVEKPGGGPQPSPRIPTFVHKRVGSLSSFSSSAAAVSADNAAFALAKLGELAQINMGRLIGPNPTETGWEILVGHLAGVAGSRERTGAVRVRASEVLNEVVVAAAKSVSEGVGDVAGVQRRILRALREGVTGADVESGPGGDAAVRSVEAGIHRSGLEALNAILEHSGQALIAGWEIVFDIIVSVFDPSMVWRRDMMREEGQGEVKDIVEGKSGKGPRLIRSSFSSLELICSDFLANLPTSCVLVLIDALFAFCSQKDDLNISLTTITFFWNVSDYLQTKGETAALMGRAEKESDLLDVVERGESGCHSALWMLLLLRLAGVSGDRRAEVRNGSIQTLFRIFDTYGHQLGPQAWSSCLKIVVFKMMNINPLPVDPEVVVPRGKTSEFKQWDDTINLVLSGIGTLYSNYFDIFAQQSEFRNTWSVFIKYLENLLARKSFDVNTNVFIVLKLVLEKVPQPEELGGASREDVWRMWSSQGVKLVEGNVLTSRTGIQETLTAYVDAFKPLYRLLEPTLDSEMAGTTLDLMRECIIFPDAPAYFQDIDMLTPLQAVILEVTQLLRTDIPGVPSLVLRQVSEFSTVAYNTKLHSGSERKGVKIPTYIALATQSMKIMETITLKHIENIEIYSSGALKTMLEALWVPIGLKYIIAPTTKRPSQWIPATRVVLSILHRALPTMDLLKVEDKDQEAVWDLIVKIIGSAIRADSKGVDEATLAADEDFDIASFLAFRKLIIPSLGRAVVPNSVVTAYIRSILGSSLLYEIGDLELPSDDGRLEFLNTRKHGKTSELVLERRARMSYVCLDELFELSRVRDDDSPEMKRLAGAAAPFLVLRAGLVLQHYISDQPLRGRMPQPVCQRKEMLYVLKNLVNLESSSKAVSIDSTHIPPSTKRHLFTLFPLISQCIAVAQGDQELLTWLSKALNEMGAAFGVC